MEQTLSLQDVAVLLNLSYRTVYNNRFRWGAFKMQGSRVWRIYRSDLEKHKQHVDNDLQVISVGRKKDNLCRSTNEKTAQSGGLMLLRQAEAELDALLKRQ
ncbi:MULTISPECIES: helix-turn-helix domain-containing protein [Actinobacillus]|uniref:Helix-turn-helix domain-containing protein n=1 Tax=Actinobacillus suis TaxID=716 RepID=A0ABT1WUT2_ACTSU|nr:MULTISPECIES: helix-turn-helix domain-containing protein [Actinobacillus]MCO4167115.1 helix-turn-helix domain-containing protein [Actinobacillus suis]MCO4169239.1 helix-turn-helix domain-containing protein [Actinobacillus suis]MCQ9629843.1 helix-turn-helix domain-containing protein [Actinobacillus suis]MCQ9632213.1 helix-turn-helix domain-containing protein [Actinobacillus suis]MCQ9711904.1 helix-turn-helix domain-containing protein [Actinobacillus suis]